MRCPACQHPEFRRDVRHIPGAWFAGRRCEACELIEVESALTDYDGAMRSLQALEAESPGADDHEFSAWQEVA